MDGGCHGWHDFVALRRVGGRWRGTISSDLGQTNSVLFDLSVWSSSAVPSQRTSDESMTDRQILSILKQSVWPSKRARVMIIDY